MLAKPLVRFQQILILSLGFIIFFFYLNVIPKPPLQQLTVFVVLAIIAKMMPASLPQGGKFSVAFIIEVALIKIFNGPVEAIYIAIISTLLGGFVSNFIEGEKLSVKSVGEIFLNTAERIIIVTISGLAYFIIKSQYINFVVMVLLYVCLDIVFLAVNKSFTNQISPIKFIESFVQTISLNYLLLAPLAFVMAIIYKSVNKNMQEIQIFSILLIFVPLLLVNYSVRLYMNIRRTYEQTIKSLAATIEARDPYMKGHSERVTHNAIEIAAEMGYPEKKMRMLQYIVLLHDVGYLEIDDEILERPGPLSESEYEEIKKHVVKGAEIISKIKFLQNKADIIKHHHEQFDGSGYPDGLKGEDIPLGARIIAVADAFDAMTTVRPYCPVKSTREAMSEIQHLAGKQFDPNIVSVFVNILRRRGEV